MGNRNKHEKIGCAINKKLDSNLSYFIYEMCTIAIYVMYTHTKKYYNVGSLLPQQTAKKYLHHGNLVK